MENQEAAFLLYSQGWEQKRIASALRVTENTVGRWKKEYNWERKRTENALAKETSESKLWKLINYQLTVMEQKTEEFIENKEFKSLDKGDIDALSKLYSSVKGKQHTWAQVVELITEFIRFCEGRNFHLVKELMELSDEFLMTKQKDL